MALQVRTKYQAGKSVRYVVQQDEPFLRYESGFEGNLSAFTDEDIIAFALEELYNTLFPNRAENEKFSSIDQQMAKMVENEENRSREFEEMKKQFDILKTESELMQQTMETLILQIMAGGSDHEEFIDNTDIGNADETFNE
ncbi:TPA: DUF1366 domain-containing protein [Streptococcus suis]